MVNWTLSSSAQSCWRRSSLLVAALALLNLGLADAQAKVEFALSKQVSAAGEPIFLDVTVTNSDRDSMEIYSADPLSFCGGFQFHLEGRSDRDAALCDAQGFGGSCLSGSRRLAPGASHTEHILLNRRWDLRKPGRYPLHVDYNLGFGQAEDDLGRFDSEARHENFAAQLEVVIEPSSDEHLKALFDDYVRDLQSKDPEKARQAAEVIGYLAPTFLEGTILKMLEMPQVQNFGIEGLRNLGTESAHRELAAFVKNYPQGEITYQDQEAIRYLGEIGDPTDVGPLLEFAHAVPPPNYNRVLAIESAGRAGGDDAVSALIAELRSASIEDRQGAVRALSLTGSRKAVPVLIGLLRSPEEGINVTAEFGLQILTHRSAVKTGPPLNPGEDYQIWTRWWNLNDATAPVFKEDECGETIPLE